MFVAIRKPLATQRPTEAAAKIALVGAQDFSGPAPLILGEDQAAYQALLAQATYKVKPKDVLKDIWVRDVVDRIWEALRLRWLKANLLRAAAHRGREDHGSSCGMDARQ